MKLYFLRHAIAVTRGTRGYADDSKRPLTPVGKNKMQHIARTIETLGLSFDLILSSPYVRALETAEIVADVFKIKKNEIKSTPCLIPGSSFKELTFEINTQSKKYRNILLVGHEPLLSECISLFLTGEQTVSIDFKKGGLCQISLDPPCQAGSATLNWLLTPSQLNLLTL